VLKVRRPDQTGDTILVEVDEATAQGRADAIAAIESHLRSEILNKGVKVALPVFGKLHDGSIRMLTVDRKAGKVNDDMSLFTEIVVQRVVVPGQEVPMSGCTSKRRAAERSSRCDEG
jgi:hypothetical protein